MDLEEVKDSQGVGVAEAGGAEGALLLLEEDIALAQLACLMKTFGKLS